MDLLRVLDKTVSFEKPTSDPFTADDVCGSAASHFKVGADKAVSTYRIDDQPPTLIDVAVAIAATRRSLDEVVCCLASEEEISSLGINIVPTPGVTPVAAVNIKHVDLAQVTLSQLSELVLAYLRRFEVVEIGTVDIAIGIEDAVNCGVIRREDLSATLVSSMAQFVSGRAYKRARRVRQAAAGQDL